MPMWLSWHFGWIPRVMIVLLLLAPVALLFERIHPGDLARRAAQRHASFDR
jgi:hypothetical protein